MDYAAGQRYTLDWLLDSCNNNVSCPLYQQINPKTSIAAGHSAGGGATLMSILILDINLNNMTFNNQFTSGFTMFASDQPATRDLILNALPTLTLQIKINKFKFAVGTQVFELN